MSPTNFEPIGECIKKVARKTPAGLVAPRGLAFGAHPTDPEACVLAQAGIFEGFVTREVVLERTLRELYMPETYFETPTVAGSMGTLDLYNEIEAEGAAYLVLSGAGLIGADAVVGTLLTFTDGKLRVADEGEVYYFEITANSAVVGGMFNSRNGELRIRARYTSGGVPITPTP